MFNRTISPFQWLLILLLSSAPSLAEESWVNLFDGKTLNGWTINPASRGGTATVVDGEIHLVGERKFFLCSEKTYSDFIFEAEVMLPAGPANSGLMFRCHVEPNKVWGYQAEIDGSKRAWSGGLFDEARRRWLYPQSPESSPSALEFQARSKGSFHRDGWNKCRIQAEGNRLRIWIHGGLCTDYLDNVDAAGYIALPHHGEKGQVYRFRNIRIAEIRKAVSLSYDQPAREWTDALPVGNGSMQFNHATMWTAGPRAYFRKAASASERAVSWQQQTKIILKKQERHRA